MPFLIILCCVVFGSHFLLKKFTNRKKPDMYHVISFNSLDGSGRLYSSILSEKEAEDLFLLWSKQGLQPVRALSSDNLEILEKFKTSMKIISSDKAT